VAATEVTLYAIERGAAWITLNRPKSRNALSQALLDELAGHLAAAEADPTVRCIVLTGAGAAFCGGGDLKSAEIGQDRAGASLADIIKAMVTSTKPVIAAVNGAAFAGGLGLVGAADIVIAATEAQFSFSEVRIGVVPAVIAVVCVPKLGAHQAMRLFLTGERFDGARAVTLGLAHRAVPAEALRAAVFEEIAGIALGGPQALRECKRLVRRAAEPPGLNGSLDAALDEMQAWSRRVFASAEAAEGIAAFREKRKPAWATNGTTP
jgi:enoyl-CoA hydratase/carnithine racemase